MYNEKIKQQYIELQNKDPKDIITLFKQVEKLEANVNLDLYNLPIEMVIKNILKQGSITSIQTARKKIALIKKYKNWALVENLIDEDYKFIDSKIDIQKIFLEYNQSIIFKSPKQLKDKLVECLYRRSETGISSDELIIAYLMLLYQGFRKDEVLSIKLNEIDLVNNNMIIKNNRTIVKVYPEFVQLFSKLYNTRIYSKISNADSNDEKMNSYFISMGNKSIAQVEDKILRFISKRLYPIIKFKSEDLFIMGRIYEAKLYNYSYKDFYNQLELELEYKIQFKEKLKLMYENW